jgi:hypothetical protein
MKKSINSNQNMRQFLQGVQFFFKAKGFKLGIYSSPSLHIVRDGFVRPNFLLDVDEWNLFLNFNNDQYNKTFVAKLNLSLSSIRMIDQAKQ